MKPSLDWLTDLNTYAVNRIKAHSDHDYYETMEEAHNLEEMRLRHCLNGSWTFHYAKNPSLRPAHRYEQDFECSKRDAIQDPGHSQLHGYSDPEYVNAMYPRDGHEDLAPPEIARADHPVGSNVKTVHVAEKMKNKPTFIAFSGV